MIDMEDEIIINIKDIEKDVLAIYKCPSCGAIIKGKINFNEDYYNCKEDMKDAKLHICSCVSGGIYSVYFQCPKCQEEIDIK